MQENQFLLFLNYLRLPYSIPKSFALLLNIHVARHTFATFALANGVSIESVAKMLGHTNVQMTRHYARVLDRTVIREMSQVRMDFQLSL